MTWLTLSPYLVVGAIITAALILIIRGVSRFLRGDTGCSSCSSSSCGTSKTAVDSRESLSGCSGCKGCPSAGRCSGADTDRSAGKIRNGRTKS